MLRKNDTSSFDAEEITIVKKPGTKPGKEEAEGGWTNHGFAKLNTQPVIPEDVISDEMDSDEREWEASQMAKVLPNSTPPNKSNTNANQIILDDLPTLDELEAQLTKELTHLDDLKRNTLAMIQDLEAKISHSTANQVVEEEENSVRTQFYKDFLKAIDEGVSSEKVNLNNVYAFIQRWKSEYPQDYDIRLAHL